MNQWIIAFVVILILVIAEWMREIHTFKITRYDITSAKLKGLTRDKKIILLSDLHNCSYGKKNQKLLDAIRKEAPDMILVAGDMLVGKEGASTDTAEFVMHELPKIADTYCANGNHEQRMKEFPEEYGGVYAPYRESLLKSGVCLLENAHSHVMWDSKEIVLWGLEIPFACYKKFHKNMLSVEEIEERIGCPDETKYNILIAHNPIFAESYAKWGADLTVSGHLHGGVVRLPAIGGVITPQFSLFPKYSGELKKIRDKAIVVSKGIGLHTIKVRLFNPAEVVVLRMTGTEE